MKHFTQTTANGLHTPPCGSSQSKSTRFSLLTSFLLFFLLFSGNIWGETTTQKFQQGSTIYCDVSASGWTDSRTIIAAFFYYQDNTDWCYEKNSGDYNNMNGSVYVGTNYTPATRVDGEQHIYKVTVPNADLGKVCFLRVSWGDANWIWAQTVKMSVDEMGANNCVHLNDNNDNQRNNCNWSSYVETPCDNPKPAADMYMAGQGFPGISWTINSITMSWDCDNGVYYKTFTNLTANNNMTYRFKLNPSTDTSWGSQLNSDAIDNSHEGANLALKSDNEDKRITFDLAQNSDVTIYTNGTKVWAATPAPEPAALNCRLRSDFWLNNSNGWLSGTEGPQFTDNGDGTATISYLVNTQAPRITFVKDGSDKSDDKWDETNSTSGFYNDGGSKYKFNKIASGVKKVTLTYTEATDKLVGVYGAYDVDYTGWKLYVDNGSALDMDNSGQRVVSLASGNHTFYITDGSGTTFYGINKFGGMYLSTSYTNQGVTITFPSQRYYDTGTTYKFNINGDNIPTYPINGQYDLSAKFSINKAANVTFSFDGGVISLAAVEPAAPHTVTIHPNNGAANFTMDVADGGTISSISASYGNGTASWYKDAELTQAFTLNSSTVTEDMDLYAKWGVSGNFYLVGDFGMHDKGSNWAFNSGLAMTTTDGVASVTYIAPKGRHRFEILTSRSSWPALANQGSGLIAASTPTLSWSNEGAGGNYHFRFDLDAPKKVTIRYDGKVSVTAEDYVVAKTGWTVASKSLFGHGSEESPDNADDGAYMNGYNMTEGQMNSDGELVIHNLNAGTYKFWIGKYNTALNKQKQNVEVFGAAHVDKANSSLGDYGSLANVSDDTYNRSIPMDDKLHRRVQFSLNQRASIKIAFDGGKITVNLLPKYTVTFNSNDGSEVASQSVFEGAQASEPSAPTKAGYEFVKWQLSGVDYTFSEAVTGNITLDAVWEYKHISSVSLNESTHSTWVGNSDFTLTLTKDPSDLSAKSVVWSSNNTSVATVSNNGTVHVEPGAGITEETVVRITCTVTDQYDVSRSAYCDVTVAPCQMTTDNLYSMNVTGDNSSTGNSATLTGLWNSSEPATITVCNVRIGNEGTPWYAYDNSSSNENTNGSVLAEQRSNADVDKWQMIAAGTTNSIPVYYLKNMATGKYMFRESSNDNSTTNSAWYTRAVKTSKDKDNSDFYKFYSATDTWGNDVIVSLAGATSNSSVQGATDYVLSREHWVSDRTWTWTSAPEHSVAAARGSNEGGNNYKGFQSSFVNIDNEYPNPAYIPSQMNSSYYRMNTNATVQANLAAALVKGAVITVSLYADAATSVKLTKTDGTEIATIDLSADAALDYTYTVNTASLLLGESAFIIKAADNHAGIASIEVSRMHAEDPDDPALAWDVVDLETTGITQSALGGNIVHTASAAGSTGAISYASSNTAVADIEADGTVLPHMAGSTTITATIEEAGCYGEASITYTITLTEPTLAEMIAADAGEGITLTHDYAENIVIDKAITINGAGHAIGNLTVETAGDLTLSGALTVNDFSIYAQAGNTTIPAASGQVRNATNLTANGNAYFYYTVDPSGTVHYGWYDFTVPFRVNVMTGIKGIQNEVLKENFVNETDYAIMEHLGEKQAAGQYAYKKFRGIMEPCRLYSITLDDDFNYNTIRFQKADGALAAGNEVTLNAYASTVDDKHANWNGVGNGTLHHADAILSTVGYIQVYQSGEKTFLPVDKNEYSLVVGSAFMVQQAGTMTLNQASHDKLLAPRRDASAQATAIQIAREGKPFSDQLYITADELAGQGYTQGVDVAKAGNIGNVNVPQIWTNAYNSKLCAHEAQLIDGEAQYTLSLYAPANGTYTLTSKNIPEGYTLYLTQNGNKLWDMSDTYVLDLTKGTTTEYGLLLVENYKMPTAVDNIYSNTDETTKIMRNGILYILQNGKVFNAQGARVK